MSTNNKLEGARADPVGLETYRELFGKENEQPLIGIREFTINHLFAKIWSRSREPIDKERMLSLRERSMITVALLAAQGHDEDLRKHIRGARHQGISEQQILEVMIHVSNYAGSSARNNGQRIALEVFKETAVACEPIDKEGMISLSERSLITVALLAAQGSDDEVRSQIRGACDQGISKHKILEIMIQVAHYAGWSAGNNGQRIAEKMQQLPDNKVMSNLQTGTAIRPFRVNDVPEAELTELRRRINATRWPERETVSDTSQGVQLETMQALAKYWATDYDWRKVEAKLKKLPNFITEIDGLNIHFIHVRSKHEGALPLIVTHGWPGSIIEQLKIIDPLTNPTAYGASASDAFDVVIPSMPGYGFSDKPTATGWDPARIARAWAVLMKRLGYTRYVAQGGDWGAIIADLMATQGRPELIGIHTNMPGVIPPDIDKAAEADSPAPAGLSDDEECAYEMLVFAYKNFTYSALMGSRPQTLYGIADSPVGLAAWLLDHDDAVGQPAAAVLSALSRTTSTTGELTRDEILDNITLFWLKKTGVSASRLYWEATKKKIRYFVPKHVSIPVAVSVFPDEVYRTPKSWAEQAYPHLIHYNQLDKGGHFAAWEQPKLFVEELRAGFKSLRQ